ncbi:hypothetical protein [Salinirubrum litoreum]|uniref:Uncharacterized protein n=1 Tax=Salinirubrum litoreum TaxID=1126234 RepID=A0ABD5RF50_9EURY|nr:hypothetical protein [Salinirubrum litoreum]
MKRYFIEISKDISKNKQNEIVRDYLQAVLRTNPSLGQVEINGMYSQLSEQNPVAVDLLLNYCEGIQIDREVDNVITGETNDATPAIIASLQLMTPALIEVVLTDNNGRVLFARHDHTHHYIDMSAEEKENVVAELDSEENGEYLKLSSYDPAENK